MAYGVGDNGTAQTFCTGDGMNIKFGVGSQHPDNRIVVLELMTIGRSDGDGDTTQTALIIVTKYGHMCSGGGKLLKPRRELKRDWSIHIQWTLVFNLAVGSFFCSGRLSIFHGCLVAFCLCLCIHSSVLFESHITWSM